MKKVLILISFFLFFLFPLSAQADYPDYQGYVNDFAHVLSQPFIDGLNNKLLSFDQQTTNQIAVVTVKTTQPDAIEDYSIHLADKWKVGQKGKDNGVIMLYAMDDHAMRIEVGRGLEGDLTDIQAKHIQTDIITPEFKAGNYEQGIDKGVNAVMATITHTATYAAAPVPNVAATQDSSGSFFGILFLIIVILIIFTAISPWTPFGGAGMWGPTVFWGGGSKDDGDGFGGFGGGGFSGGGSSSNW